MSAHARQRAFSAVNGCVRLIAAALMLGFGVCVSDGLYAATDNVSEFQALAGASTPQSVPIFIASTRRGGGGGTRFSLDSVIIPAGHMAGSIEGEFAVASRRKLDETGFLEEIAAHAAARVGPSRDLLLYVHGYDISLDEARFRVAQIVADSGFSGVPALFTWGTNSHSGLQAYEADKESATVARDALEDLLLDLARVPGAGRIRILAHSMGAWLAMESLRGLAISGHPDLDGKLGEVMLAAPDIDLNVFIQQVWRVGAKHVSLFVARDDSALLLSSRIAGGRPRLGAMDLSNPKDWGVLDALGVSVHDLSGLRTDFMGHNTFAEAPAVVRQIGAQLATPAEEESNGMELSGDDMRSGSPTGVSSYSIEAAPSGLVVGGHPAGAQSATGDH